MAYDRMKEIPDDGINGISRPNGLRSFTFLESVSTVGISNWCLIDQGCTDVAFHLQIPASSGGAISAQIELSYDDPNKIINGVTPVYTPWGPGEITGSTSVVTNTVSTTKCVRAWRLNVLANPGSLPVNALAQI